ncbi:UNVERIFIED_CONTAM: hypothetical protein PYX00_000433 [Menopon gallinae]|uniref:UDP-glucuronosyltransferase n=1 Tax=Menopon gallinae TaxID=328185 RepID=A0AAW2IA02_9NEOP
MFEPYIRELAQRGHKITLISHFPVKKQSPNITFISLEGTAEEILFNSLSLKDKDVLLSSPFSALETLNNWGQKACDTALSHPPIRRLIDSKPKFDLVIVEYFNTDCFSVFSYIFKAPLMAIFSSVLMPWHYDRFGSPDNPSYIVNHMNNYPSEMNLKQRVLNTIATFGLKIYYRVFFSWPTDKIIRKHLKEGIPPVSEIVKNTSVFLVNSHFSVFQARPLVPGIVEVGGIHTGPGAALPKHLKDYLDKGSTILGYTIDEERRKAIANTFRKLPLNVIWKWENDTMPDKPSNVLIQKWIPQNDLLAHPNVKLFVTHSGLMGTEEAVYHGVPMVMIPLFGDQPINAASCKEKGLGVVVDYLTVTEETFSNAVRTVLEDKRYKERADYASKTFRDRPMSSMNSAIYWTEYVIRYKGAPHLRSAAVHLPWYSEYLLDVLLIFCSVIYAVFSVAKFLVKKCLKFVKGEKKKQKRQ